MKIRLAEILLSRFEWGFVIGGILWDDGTFSCALGYLWHPEQKRHLFMFLGVAFILSYGEDDED